MGKRTRSSGWLWLGGLGGFLLGLMGFGRRAQATSATEPTPQWLEPPLSPEEPPALPSSPEPIEPAPERHGAPAERLAAHALNELQFWSGHTETDPAVQDRLVQYWKTALRGRHPYDAFGPGWQQKQPWSAAFISHLANEALPGSLPPAASHWVYTRRARRPVPQEGGFVAYDPAQQPVKPGDILVKNRSGKDRAWADLQTVPFSPSHGDFIVGLRDQGRTALGVGGNLSHSVRQKRHLLDEQGRSPDAIAVLRYHPPAPLPLV